MKATAQHNSQIFKNIKRSLDPAYSYLLFESSFSSEDNEVFQIIIDNISNLNLGKFESKIHHDKILGLSLLVVRIDPDRADNIMQDILNIGIPDEITFYSYGTAFNVDAIIK
jgi:hypothetical protein